MNDIPKGKGVTLTATTPENARLYKMALTELALQFMEIPVDGILGKEVKFFVGFNDESIIEGVIETLKSELEKNDSIATEYKRRLMSYEILFNPDVT